MSEEYRIKLNISDSPIIQGPKFIWRDGVKHIVLRKEGDEYVCVLAPIPKAAPFYHGEDTPRPSGVAQYYPVIIGKPNE